MHSVAAMLDLCPFGRVSVTRRSRPDDWTPEHGVPSAGVYTFGQAAPEAPTGFHFLTVYNLEAADMRVMVAPFDASGRDDAAAVEAPFTWDELED